MKNQARKYLSSVLASIAILTIGCDGTNNPSGSGTLPPAPPEALFFVANYTSASISAYASYAAGGPVVPYGTIPAGGNNPIRMLVHPSGRYLFVGFKNTAVINVFRIDAAQPAGLVKVASAVNSSGANYFSQSADGTHLFATDYSYNVIGSYVFDSVSGTLTAAAGSPFTIPGYQTVGMAAAPDGRHLYFSDAATHTLKSHAVSAAGVITVAAASSAAGVASSTEVSVSPAGDRVYMIQNGQIAAYPVVNSTGVLSAGFAAWTVTDPVAQVFFVSATIALSTRYASGNGICYVNTVNPSTGVFTDNEKGFFGFSTYIPERVAASPDGKFFGVVSAFSGRDAFFFKRNPDGYYGAIGLAPTPSEATTSDVAAVSL